MTNYQIYMYGGALAFLVMRKPIVALIWACLIFFGALPEGDYTYGLLAFAGFVIAGNLFKV